MSKLWVKLRQLDEKVKATEAVSRLKCLRGVREIASGLRPRNVQVVEAPTVTGRLPRAQERPRNVRRLEAPEPSRGNAHNCRILRGASGDEAVSRLKCLRGNREIAAGARAPSQRPLLEALCAGGLLRGWRASQRPPGRGAAIPSPLWGEG